MFNNEAPELSVALLNVTAFVSQFITSLALEAEESTYAAQISFDYKKELPQPNQRYATTVKSPPSPKSKTIFSRH